MKPFDAGTIDWPTGLLTHWQAEGLVEMHRTGHWPEGEVRSEAGRHNFSFSYICGNIYCVITDVSSSPEENKTSIHQLSKDRYFTLVKAIEVIDLGGFTLLRRLPVETEQVLKK